MRWFPLFEEKKKRKKSILYPIFCCFFRSFFSAFCLFFSSFCFCFATGYLISQSKRPKTKLRLYNEWVTWFFSYYMAFCRSAHRWNAIAHLGKSNGYAGNQFLTIKMSMGFIVFNDFSPVAFIFFSLHFLQCAPFFSRCSHSFDEYFIVKLKVNGKASHFDKLREE